MKTVLTTLNAKYIHTSLALRLLYVANKDDFDITFREYVIKEPVEKIAENLLALRPDVVGISVSIWNVEQSRRLAGLLKLAHPELIVVLGGPEVSYDVAYFLNNWPVDYVISGEGEFVLGELLAALREEREVRIDGVSSATYISPVVVKADLKKIEQLPSPYMLEEDRAELGNRLVYFESSRGCPYQCQYCLSSLEKGVRYYSSEYIRKNLEYLLAGGARQIKFLDRTFNLNREHTMQVFDFLMRHHRPGISCQFEIYADLLADDTIEYLNQNLPHNYFRFEIGIQSTYEPTNEAVNRKQDFQLLASAIGKLVRGGKIALHLDLIAGLPHENMSRFIRSFNDVFALGAGEVQLGFLKLLRGTALRKDAEQYGYVYNVSAPYEIQCNNDISKEELERIHDAEHALERYWNSGRFPRTMQALTKEYYAGRYFELFDEIASFYKEKQYLHHAYQLEDVFRYLHEFLQSRGIDLFELLRRDYYDHFKIRPHGFWQHPVDKKSRKRMLYAIAQDKDFLCRNNLQPKDVEKRAVIDPDEDGFYRLTFFMPEREPCPLSLLYPEEELLKP